MCVYTRNRTLLIKYIHYLYLHEWQKEECVIYIFMYMKTRANYVSHIFSSPVSFDLEGFNISFCLVRRKLYLKKKPKKQRDEEKKKRKDDGINFPFFIEPSHKIIRSSVVFLRSARTQTGSTNSSLPSHANDFLAFSPKP